MPYFVKKVTKSAPPALLRRREECVPPVEPFDLSAYYPIFLLAALTLVTLLERPSAGRYVAFFVVLGLAYLTRSQAVVVAAAALTAPLLLGLFRRGALRASLWSYRVLYAVFGAGAIVVVAVQAVRGRPLSALLGSYAPRRSGLTFASGRRERTTGFEPATLALARCRRPIR